MYDDQRYLQHMRRQSKRIASMLKAFFEPLHEVDDRQQYTFIKTFDRLEWRNSSLPDIHHKLIHFLLQTCQRLDQTQQVKQISQRILQLEMRPDTWKKLQFDYISFFPAITW